MTNNSQESDMTSQSILLTLILIFGLIMMIWFSLMLFGQPIAASRFYLSALKQRDQISHVMEYKDTIRTHQTYSEIAKVRVTCEKAGEVKWCDSIMPKVGHEVWVYSNSDFTDKIAFFENASFTDVFLGLFRSNNRDFTISPYVFSLVVLGASAFCVTHVVKRVGEISILAAKSYPDQKSEVLKKYFDNLPAKDVSTFSMFLLNIMAMQRASRDVALYLGFLMAYIVIGAWTFEQLFNFASGMSLDMHSVLYGIGFVAIVVAIVAPLPEAAIKYKKSQGESVLQDTVFLTIKSVFLLYGIFALSNKAWESLHSENGGVSIIPMMQELLKSIFS